MTWRRVGGDIGLLVGTNLLANILFFATHPVFTPYYTVPIAALSLWTLLFVTVVVWPDKFSQSGVTAVPFVTA